MPFPRGISLKVNVVVQLKFELAHYDVTVQHMSHDGTGPSPFVIIVEWLVPHDFWYLGGIKDVAFLKHVGTEKSQSVVRPTLDVTPTVCETYNISWTVPLQLINNWLFHCVSFPYHDTTVIKVE